MQLPHRPDRTFPSYVAVDGWDDHLHHLDALIVEEPGQPDTPRSGALHPNPDHLTEADQPAEKILEADSVDGRRFVG